MSEKQAPNGKEFDPTDAFREMRNSYLDAWSKTMVDAVNSDAYAKASGMMLNTYLSSSSPFREAVEKVMLQALQQFSMPSRADVVSIAERAVKIEKRLTKPTSARRAPARAPDRGSKKKGKR